MSDQLENDPDFDGCECVFSYEYAMRRLLQALRNGQSYCTDTECVDLPSLTSNPNSSDEFSTFLMMIILLSGAMYLLLPSIFKQRENTVKTNRSEDHPRSDDDPPPPSPTVG